MTHDGSSPADKASLELEREEQLSSDLKITDAWIDAMFDPELGFVGRDLKGKIDGSTLLEKHDMKLKLNAVFNSYAYPPNEGEKGLKNELIYGLPALDSKAVLLGARCHEFIHARQYQNATAPHANPFNEITPFFLSPFDYVRLKEALEQDAYAKGAWLQTLAEHNDPEVKNALDRTPLPVKSFENIRHNSASLSETFTRSAKSAGNRRGKWLADNSVTPARDLWHENALKEYASVMGVRIKNGETDFSFVRLEEKDLREIGTAFGPDTFDGNMTPVLSATNKARLETLEALLKIKDRDKLPTLDTVLEKQKMSREEYRTTSQTHVGAPKTRRADN